MGLKSSTAHGRFGTVGDGETWGGDKNKLTNKYQILPCHDLKKKCKESKNLIQGLRKTMVNSLENRGG